MKHPTKKELNKQFVDEYISKQFGLHLQARPDDRKNAAMFVVGSLEGLLLSVMDELPYNIYSDLTAKLKG